MTDFSSKVAVLVCAWERKTITELCLQQLVDTQNEAVLVVVDDGSTAYDQTFLQPLCDVLLRHATHGPGGSKGVAQLRLEGLKYVLSEFPDVEWIYSTDSDCYHDPGWLERLESMVTRFPDFDMHSLYYSRVQARRGSELSTARMTAHKAIQRAECPGCSMGIRAQRLREIGEPFGITPDAMVTHGAWDHCITAALGRKILVSHNSYLEHFGAGGIHSDGPVPDTGLNLTEFLQKRRPEILKLLAKEEEC